MKREGVPAESNVEAPEELLAYEKWWNKTFGREPNPEEDKQLFDLARELAKKDEKFKDILSESLSKEFIENDDGLEDHKQRRWALVTSLSTYGKEFGLTVD